MSARAWGCVALAGLVVGTAAGLRLALHASGDVVVLLALVVLLGTQLAAGAQALAGAVGGRWSPYGPLGVALAPVVLALVLAFMTGQPTAAVYPAAAATAFIAVVAQLSKGVARDG